MRSDFSLNNNNSAYILRAYVLCYRGVPWVFTVERAYDIDKAEGSCQTMTKRTVRIIV